MANKHMKRYLTSLIIREMKIKTTVRYHLTPVSMAIIKDSINKPWQRCGEREALYTVGGDVNATTVENTMEVSHKTKNRTAI